MKLKILAAGSLAISALWLVGCAGHVLDRSKAGAPSGEFFRPVEQEIDPVSPMVLRVVGYGAVDPSAKQSTAQKRLMAIRASRMDAYRAMAERVYGTSVQGSTTVRDMVVQNDRFRSYVETYMHGARVVSTDQMPDGSTETVLEMIIDQGFRNCLQTMDSQRFNVDCRVPLGGANPHQFATSQRNRIEDESSLPDGGFYFIE